jgi:hypothetical protein
MRRGTATAACCSGSGSLNEYELDLLAPALAFGPLREGAPGPKRQDQPAGSSPTMTGALPTFSEASSGLFFGVRSRSELVGQHRLKRIF